MSTCPMGKKFKSHNRQLGRPTEKSDRPWQFQVASHQYSDCVLLVFRKSKDLYLIITQKLIIHEIRRISGEIHPKPYKFRCFSKNSSVWGVHGGGYDPRFHEIQGHSPSPAFIKLNSFCWNIWIYKVLGGFHLKSAGFHVKSKDHLQGIVTLCFVSVFSDVEYMPVISSAMWPNEQFEVSTEQVINVNLKIAWQQSQIACIIVSHQLRSDNGSLLT